MIYFPCICSSKVFKDNSLIMQEENLILNHIIKETEFCILKSKTVKVRRKRDLMVCFRNNEFQGLCLFLDNKCGEMGYCQKYKWRLLLPKYQRKEYFTKESPVISLIRILNQITDIFLRIWKIVRYMAVKTS